MSPFDVRVIPPNKREYYSIENSKQRLAFEIHAIDDKKYHAGFALYHHAAKYDCCLLAPYTSKWNPIKHQVYPRNIQSNQLKYQHVDL